MPDSTQDRTPAAIPTRLTREYGIRIRSSVTGMEILPTSTSPPRVTMPVEWRAGRIPRSPRQLPLVVNGCAL